MNIAVLSLTRDRLDYTRHCFASLLANAGCDFDWFITDNGSTDGTVDWLLDNTDATVTSYTDNAGISPALNAMIDDALASADYDVIVKIDNDCELVTPDTLSDVCRLVSDHDAILSPWIKGLRQPPQPLPGVAHPSGQITRMPVIGGIFTAVPAGVFEDGYRHPLIPTLDGEDFNLCQWYRSQGGTVGYVDGYEAWHYEGTDGQHARYPDYFSRRAEEREAAARLVTW